MEATGWPWWLFVEAALWSLSIVQWRRLRTAPLTDRAFWGALAVFNTGLILWTIGPWPKAAATAWLGLALATWLCGALVALGGRTAEHRRLGMVLALLGAAGTTAWLGAYEVAGCCGIAIVLLMRSGPLWKMTVTTDPPEEAGGLDRRDDWLLGTTLAVSLVLGLGVLRVGWLSESIATSPNRWRMVWPQVQHHAADAMPSLEAQRRLLPVEWWLAGGLVVLAAWQTGRPSTIETTTLQTGEWR